MTNPVTVYFDRIVGRPPVEFDWLKVGQILGRLGIEDFIAVNELACDRLEFKHAADAATFRLFADFETFNKEEADRRSNAHQDMVNSLLPKISPANLARHAALLKAGLPPSVAGGNGVSFKTIYEAAADEDDAPKGSEGRRNG